MKDENAIHANITFRAIVLNIDQGLFGVDGCSLRAGRSSREQSEKESEWEWAGHHGGIIRVGFAPADPMLVADDKGPAHDSKVALRFEWFTRSTACWNH